MAEQFNLKAIPKDVFKKPILIGPVWELLKPEFVRTYVDQTEFTGLQLPNGWVILSGYSRTKAARDIGLTTMNAEDLNGKKYVLRFKGR